MASVWCTFRLATIFLILWLILGKDSSDSEINTHAYILAVGFLLFLVICLYTVPQYIVKLNEALDDTQPPVIKRKVSSVSVIVDEEGDPPSNLTEEHIKELRSFQAYIESTSWCSERPGKSAGNTLQVPQNQFM